MLSSIGLLMSNQLLATSEEEILLSIAPPEIHVRHGMFDLQSTPPAAEKLHIQRDIFSRNGLQLAANDRMTSVKVCLHSQEILAVLSPDNFRSNSSLLSAQLLSSSRNQSLVIDQPSLLFSEYDALRINGQKILKDQGLLVSASSKIHVSSENEQFVMILSLNQHPEIIPRML